MLLFSGCSGDDPVVSDADREAGAEAHPQLLAEFGGAYSGEESAYVVRLGGKVANAAGLGGRCTFTLVNSDVVNAFAVPGCYIYVTRGLMGIVNSEGELASVLAHEVGHITARHSQRQQRRSIWRGLGVLAVQVLTGSERLTRIAGEAAAFFTLRYSRGQEYEADDLGLTYLRGAGYDPYAAADMLDALGRQESFLARTRGRDEARSLPEWTRTHPLTTNRVTRAREQAAATGLEADALPENELPFLREVDGLLYGDDPEQGFVIGRRFAHPVMRIGFEAPQGFTLTNSPQAILIEGPDGLRGEFAGGPMPPGGLEAYASSVLRQLLGDTPVEPGEVRRVVVNGVPSIQSQMRIQTSDGAVTLSLAAYRGAGDGAYHFVMIGNPSAPSAAAVASLFGSFRLLGEEEARRLKPRWIRVAKVSPGETAQSLAARMATDAPLEHFLMLNGRSGDQPVRPGELVKIVTYTR
ncbi:M48 family metalloprotease [Sphingomonas parva]|nr:M48 family metalloprotease [Sphingomonas parva]